MNAFERARHFKKSEMLIVNLNEHYVECFVCGELTLPKYGIPTYEDTILPNDWPGEWFGQTVCERCFIAQEQIQRPTEKEELICLTYDV
jgi:hypothetical protein